MMFEGWTENKQRENICTNILTPNAGFFFLSLILRVSEVTQDLLSAHTCALQNTKQMSTSLYPLHLECALSPEFFSLNFSTQEFSGFILVFISSK